MAEKDLEDFELEVDESQEDEAYISYDIATYPSDFTLSGIVDMWQTSDIVVPDFQREFVWSIKQASLLIESFLLGLPVPPVFFYVDEDNKSLVIDGQQRILSTVFFFEGFFGVESLGRRQVFRLQGLDEKSPYYRKTFDELPDTAQRKLRNTVLRAINVRQLSPARENTSVFHIFERLNTGGTPLKSQEIRNVVFRSRLVQVLREVNQDQNWRQLLGAKALSKHQVDVELVLRVLALSRGPEDYEKPMKEFLNKAMRRNQSGETAEVLSFIGKFPIVTEILSDRLGPKPFHLRGRLNTAALDSVLCTLLKNVERIPNDLKARFEKLKKDLEFEQVTTTGTTDTTSVKQRFDIVSSYIFGK